MTKQTENVTKEQLLMVLSAIQRCATYKQKISAVLDLETAGRLAGLALSMSNAGSKEMADAKWVEIETIAGWRA